MNSDRNEDPRIELQSDILDDGLPVPDGSFDYVVSIHALPEIPYSKLVTVLGELRRVLKPGGVLRLGLPDAEKGFNAYLRGDLDYFLIPDEHAKSVGAKLITQLLWYGYNASLFTADFVEELLQRADFHEVVRCGFGETASEYADIVELDNREPESLFVEATK